MINYYGTLRITNGRTLEQWKVTGKYDKLLNEGYQFNFGCGRFSKIKCTCCKCK